MAKYLSSTLKHGSIYALGVLLSRAIGFVMIPVYTRVLTPADYGILEVLSMTTDIIAMMTGLGLSWAVMRYYYLYDDPRDKQAVISTAAVMLISLFALAAVPGFLLGRPLSVLLLASADHVHVVRLALISFVLMATVEIPLVYLRARQQSLQVVGAGLVRFLVGLGFNILLVVFLRMGVAGVLYSSIISTAVVGGYLGVATLRETGLRLSRPIAAKLVRYGAPLIGWEIGSFVLHYSDRYFLRAYDSLTGVGLYSLAYKFAMLISLFIAGPFGEIWAPKALEIEKAEGTQAAPVLRSILSYYNLFLVFCALGIALFASDVIRVLAAPEFHSASRAVPALCVAMILFNYRHISQLGAIIRERTMLITYSTTIAAVSVVGLNFLLIPRWGIMGAAVATVGAFSVEFVVMSWLSARVYAFRYPAAALFRPVVLAGIVFVATEAILPAEPAIVLSLAVKAVACGAYVALLMVTGTISAEQRGLLLRGVRHPRWGLRALRGG